MDSGGSVSDIVELIEPAGYINELTRRLQSFKYFLFPVGNFILVSPDARTILPEQPKKPTRAISVVISFIFIVIFLVPIKLLVYRNIVNYFSIDFHLFPRGAVVEHN
jgi:hypothetical protein